MGYLHDITYKHILCLLRRKRIACCMLCDFADWTNDQSQLGYQCISNIKVQFGQTLESFYSKSTSGESGPAVRSSIKTKTNQASEKMTGRLSYCLWTDVLLVCNTSPRGWGTDRSRPACDDSSKLRCIAFTRVMKSGHQRGKPRKPVFCSHHMNFPTRFLGLKLIREPLGNLFPILFHACEFPRTCVCT